MCVCWGCLAPVVCSADGSSAYLCVQSRKGAGLWWSGRVLCVRECVPPCYVSLLSPPLFRCRSFTPSLPSTLPHPQVPSIQQTAALALGRLANYSDDLAEAVVANEILPQLVYSLGEQNVCFAFAVCSVHASFAGPSPFPPPPPSPGRPCPWPA